jgi:hypothetical protein
MLEELPAEPEPVEQPAPTRDLAAELNALVGDPRPCLAAAADGPPGRVTITVTASVSSAGVIIRATATGGLPREALACVEERVKRGRMRGPVPDAPRTVSTTVALDRVARPAP